MNIDILTLFPDSVDAMLNISILGRAQERDFLRIETHQIRDYTLNKQKQVDDYPYGGGRGAVMQADPLYRCWEHICQEAGERVHTIYMSPAGKTFTQADAKRLAWEQDRLILVCGHYEGVDERVLEEIVDEEISIGDYVLTGGELPALVMMDAISRLVPGVLNNCISAQTESFSGSLLEYPQYTRPEHWRDRSVPPVLLSGNHRKLAEWYREQSVIRTALMRPDLLENAELTQEERKLADSINNKKN